MKTVHAQFNLTYPATPEEAERELRKIEAAGRTCYKSGHKIDDESYLKFIANIIRRGHLSVIEHGMATAHIVTDRGITHEIVRHRIASFSQESTRYCNYSQDRFGNELTFIEPPQLHSSYDEWRQAMEDAERHYFAMIKAGRPPQIARSVLPNSLKAEIWITANLREWLHIFKLRTSQAAHPQIRQVMVSGLHQMSILMPVVFGEMWRTTT
jgi:thymidylate synthase (FAD)